MMRWRRLSDKTGKRRVEPSTLFIVEPVAGLLKLDKLRAFDAFVHAFGQVKGADAILDSVEDHVGTLMPAMSLRRSASRSSTAHWMVAYAEAARPRSRFHALNCALSLPGLAKNIWLKLLSMAGRSSYAWLISPSTALFSIP